MPKRATQAVLRRCVLFDPLAVSRTGHTVLQTGQRVPHLSISNAQQSVVPRLCPGKTCLDIALTAWQGRSRSPIFFRHSGAVSGRQPGC